MLRALYLHKLHKKLGARFRPYGGWLLPLLYESILSEHMYVRISAAVFDLSYLGRIEVRGKGHRRFLSRHLTRSVERLPEGKCICALLLTEEGTIFADCMVYVLRGRCTVSVNPLNTEKVYRRLAGDAPDGVDVRDISEKWLCISVQGRRSAPILQHLTDMDLSLLRTGFACEAFCVGGHEAVIARTGYSGEDGFEVLVPPDGAYSLFDSLLQVGTHQHLVPAGTGARFSLRLEACFPLYGKEIDEETDPLEAGLERFVDWENDFVGKAGLLKRKEDGAKRTLTPLKIDGPRIAREDDAVFFRGELVGRVARGTFSPVMKQPIATAFLHPDLNRAGTTVEVAIRGKRYPAVVARKPFYFVKR
ncbi:MAG: glycine cleavage system aminomethyltransferase GcvT [Planctomycetota bacterium]|nr:MAG: glycine cleavage system aminomethyltransferase GcvT [Planctomycetota bacterium]